MSLIEVAFKGNRKAFFLWESEELPPLRVGVIVEADRGEDYGTVHATGELAEQRFAKVAHGKLALEAEGQAEAPPRKAKRVATVPDAQRAGELREQDENARRRAMERVKANGLVMKLSDAEWQWDRRKLTIYFTAEKRVDFRNLVRDLASLFRTRIELKQIGVRDEAKRLSGVGRCGREYCSASWLPELRPVNLGVAKDQRLSLNPSQISGACGRLMCCLRYEHDFYVQSRKRFPKEGRILYTTKGEEKVVSNDIFNERVTLRNPEGELRIVPLGDLRREIAGGGLPEPEPAGADEEQVIPPDVTEEELIRMTDTAERPAFRPDFRPPARRAPEPVHGPNGGEAAPIEITRRSPAPSDTRKVVLSTETAEEAPSALGTDDETVDEAGVPRPVRRRRGRRGGRRGRGGSTAASGESGTEPNVVDSQGGGGEPGDEGGVDE